MSYALFVNIAMYKIANVIQYNPHENLNIKTCVVVSIFLCITRIHYPKHHFLPVHFDYSNITSICLYVVISAFGPEFLLVKKEKKKVVTSVATGRK